MHAHALAKILPIDRLEADLVDRFRGNLATFSLTDIPQVGSVGTRKAAPPPTFGQSERVSGGGSQVPEATEPELAG